MSTRQEILSAYSIDESNGIVVGSGILDVMGIRESGDLDIVVSPETFSRLELSGSFIPAEDHGKTILTTDGIDILPYWGVLEKEQLYEDLFEHSVVIEEVRYVSLEFLLQVKQSWLHDEDVRQKDKDDVKLIEEYMNRRA